MFSANVFKALPDPFSVRHYHIDIVSLVVVRFVVVVFLFVYYLYYV